MSILTDIAQRVKVVLEGVELSQKFDLHRNYGDWEDKLADFDKLLRIDVVPQSCQSTLFDRGAIRYECRISILLRKRIFPQDRKEGRIDPAIIDQLVGDLETVHEYFVPSQPGQNGLLLPSGYTRHANWLEGAIKAPYSRKLLKEGQYSGWCEVVFGYSSTPGA